MKIHKMDAWIDENDTIARMMRSTSRGFAAEFQKNEKPLERMHRAYLTSLIAVLAEAILLVVDLAGR